jgi:hypothetical protein
MSLEHSTVGRHCAHELRTTNYELEYQWSLAKRRKATAASVASWNDSILPKDFLLDSYGLMIFWKTT